MSKVIHKPWGKEVWLELNDKYCYKRIYVNAGTKTSYQYHEQKLETNFLIEGTAELWLENDEGVVEKKIIEAGDYFTVIPPRKHRVIAITDIIMQEVSTPEVDDVVRISDDAGRSSGKIEHEHLSPAICILTAGLGSRLENLTDHINKALLPLDNKAVISHLIEKTPKDYDIVVALGYRGDMVREYCEAAHPDRNFIFVDVDMYEGEGTGPGYSIKQCKEHLQRPFIWAAADTVILDNLPELDTNWLGVYPTGIPELYATVDIDSEENITTLVNKSNSGYNHAFIGLAGVYDFSVFWNKLDTNSSEIVSAYYDLSEYSIMKAKKFDWYDVGTVDNYIKAKSVFEKAKQYCIPKVNGEFLYKVNGNFVKLSSDKKFISNRIARSEVLTNLVPELTYKGNSVYSYDWVEGDTLYNLNDSNLFKSFLHYAQKTLWDRFDFVGDFSKLCEDFYYHKTINRLDLFLSNKDSFFSGEHVVNGVHTKPIRELLSKFDWDSLYDGIPTKIFHGDFHFDHVIYQEPNEYYLIDWRQDFAGSNIGDVYYDLAKMYGGILMCYELMKDDNNFSYSVTGINVSYEYRNNSTLSEFVSYYENWIVDCGYDLRKVRLITSLIWLNMAPLHEEKFGNLLFFKSKEYIQRLVNEQ